MKKKTKTSYKFIYYLMFTASVMLIFLSIVLFCIGFHNVDLGVNFICSDDVVDRGLDDVLRTPEDMYLLGVKQMRNSFLLMFFSAFVLGYFWYYVFTKNYFNEEKNKRRNKHAKRKFTSKNRWNI